MTIKKGDTVSLDYEGKLETGEVFDSSKHGDHSHPLEFKTGEGKVIPGFEKAVIGMKKGDKKEFSIEPKDAYGEPNPQLIQEIPRSQLPEGQEPKEGMVLMANSPDGRQFPLKIAKVGKETVTVDLNHPLAGKKLIFNIEIIDVK
jgi:FKBP-type peptidyl-prolyl cis-trans isomerase 2